MRLLNLLVLAGSILSLTPAAAAERSGSYRAYVDGPWGQIHVRVDGPAKGPTVVLVHKMVWSSIEFAKAQPILAKRGVRSIAVDLPGYGLSDGPAAEPSADDYADALLPVLDGMGVRKAVMVGANTGATLVTAFALRHPDRTTAVVMDGPPIFEGEALKTFLAEPEFDRTARPHGATLMARWNDVAALGKDGGLSDDAIQTGLLQFFQAGPHYLYGHHAVGHYDLKAALYKIKAPVMLITYPGDQLRATAMAVAKAHPQFTVSEIGWTGMTADYQAPEAWANALADYVLAQPR